MGDSFAFSPISVTVSVTNTAKSPNFSPNFVTFYSTEFPPEFSPNLVTYYSPKFSPFSSILHNLCQNRRKFNRKSVSSLPSKDFTFKSFCTFPHLNTLGAFIRIFITGGKSQPSEKMKGISLLPSVMIKS